MSVTGIEEDKTIEHRIEHLYLNAVSPYSDGWLASGYKKELFMLKHKIDKLLKKCPDFGILEEEWEKEIVFNILKDE